MMIAWLPMAQRGPMRINCVAPSAHPQLIKTRSPISSVAPDDADSSSVQVCEMSLVWFPIRIVPSFRILGCP
jgi:hypothetical protein